MRIQCKKLSKKTSNVTPDERAIRAASILIQMAKGKGCFAENDSPSRHVKDGLDKISDCRLTENTKDCCDRFKKDKLMKMENSEKLDLQSARATVAERKSRKRTFHSLEKSCTRNLQKEMERETRCIAPTITGTFSFSIIHLLCAVRNALITPPAKNNSIIFDKYVEASKKKQTRDSEGVIRIDKHGGHFSGLNGDVQNHLPSLTTREIVKRVRLNPRDFRILEANEPIQELVSGVLKVFSSRTASVGAKLRKALVVYERHSKRWSWIGPLPSFSLHSRETSPKYWGLPYKTLVEMVDSFASWLKQGQEIMLQKISTLPKPPHELMQCVNYGERFMQPRTAKSIRTISPCCEEIRAYFRREETLRYKIPDRAFPYTAVDGRRSAVAPLKRCSGKALLKVRDHHILKKNRPAHFTVLCLVRDATARLPGGVGTRADICVFVRDSQYIVEDITDLQVSQVVSGALDRLHYENDPCVRFDKERRLWAYLHGDRQEGDFDFDSTFSNKSRKRAKKNQL
ncbi:hypothetical protein K7X08_007285 [Anisodus acutangulus]|uniref:Nuclear factor related to kappa-B-binding protein second winged helix domain-containing protein n=1 Tax=Anisodus acutangulus TaxID=402998 RepID=A0A9Q1LGA4_9SOLA|nr:hypothetical protein K7X08_007285 [Anisodus acutangulus]